MEIALDANGLARIVYDEKDVDMRMTATFQMYNEYGFGNSLPNAQVRWASLRGFIGCGVLGCLVDKHDSLSVPHIFIDESLKGIRMGPMANLTLIHEMCHLKVIGHGPEFVKELLRALQNVSWEPLLGECTPGFRLKDLQD